MNALLNLFLDKKITQLSIGEYQIQLNMESDASISIDSSIDVLINGTTTTCSATSPKSCEALLNIVGQKVLSIELLDNKSLMLDLTGGIQLIINKHEDESESYQVHINNEFLVF